MNVRPPELIAESASASVVEREARQQQALLVVNTIARATGRELQVMASGNGTFDNVHGIHLLVPEITSRGPIQDAQFQFEKRMLSGAADSAHAVIAGDISIVHEGGAGSSTRVAAKCYQKRTYEERLARAHSEVTVMQDMARRGELALEPVAVAIAPDRSSGGTSVVLLTRFNDDLYTLDSNPWGRGPNSFNLDNATLAAQALGRFNHMGYQHNDAKIKNVASVIGRGVGMIDFETTQVIDPSDPIQAQDAAYADLDYLMNSLADKGLFKLRQGRNFTDNSHRIVSAVQRICEDGYLTAWHDASPEVQSSVYDVTLQVADNVLQRSLGSPVLV